MRELRTLRLPQLVEARRQRSSSASSEPDLPDLSDLQQHGSPLHPSHSHSSSSDPQSPVTPTFSLRCHSRLPSSSSSLASSPTMRESIDGFAAKRPLTEVKEEPQHEKDDFEMLDAPARDPNPRTPMKKDEAVAHFERDSLSTADYDWVDTPAFEGFDYEYTMTKRRCPEPSSPSSPSSLGARLSSRFPVISQKWKTRKEQRRSTSLIDGPHQQQEAMTRSRASSMRSPSILDGRTDGRTDAPVTPNQSFVAESTEQIPGATDAKEDELASDEAESAGLTRTPLLPPVMSALATDVEQVQSPLQSPTVADSPAFGVARSPLDGSPLVHAGLPSPPLSTRPSFSSFHHRPVVPSADIPPLLLAAPQDEWAIKLGHANFTIHPVPYEAPSPTILDCKQLRSDWDKARHCFAQHLARTAAHYGSTSKIYQLTEEKWAGIEAVWKRNHEQALATVVPQPLPSPADSVNLSRAGLPSPLQQEQHQELDDLPPPPPSPLQDPPMSPIKIPPLNGAQSDKFPRIGDSGIVGPMEQAPPRSVASPPRTGGGKKRAFWKFLQGMLPSAVALGR